MLNTIEKASRIHVFPCGSVVDLEYVVFISAIEQSAADSTFKFSYQLNIDSSATYRLSNANFSILNKIREDLVAAYIKYMNNL